MSENNKTIAIFDFDNTITNRDTLFDFFLFSFGKKKFMFKIILLTPVLILTKLKFLSAQKGKQILLKSFLNGISALDFQNFCINYKHRISNILKKEAIKKIHWHIHNNHETIILSASIEDWIKPWASEIGINIVLGTELDKTGFYLSGNIKGLNCKGKAKLDRLIERLPNYQDYTIYAYGDSKADRYILNIANYPFFKKF